MPRPLCIKVVDRDVDEVTGEGKFDPCATECPNQHTWCQVFPEYRCLASELMWARFRTTQFALERMGQVGDELARMRDEATTRLWPDASAEEKLTVRYMCEGFSRRDAQLRASQAKDMEYLTEYDDFMF